MNGGKSLNRTRESFKDFLFSFLNENANIQEFSIYSSCATVIIYLISDWRFLLLCSLNLSILSSSNREGMQQMFAKYLLNRDHRYRGLWLNDVEEEEEFKWIFWQKKNIWNSFDFVHNNNRDNIRNFFENFLQSIYWLFLEGIYVHALRYNR